jgi:hypothetical protein
MSAAPHANGHLYRTDAYQLVFHIENPFKGFLVFVNEKSATRAKAWVADFFVILRQSTTIWQRKSLS